MNVRKIVLSFFLFMQLSFLVIAQSSREHLLMDSGWRFALGMHTMRRKILTMAPRTFPILQRRDTATVQHRKILMTVHGEKLIYLTIGV